MQCEARRGAKSVEPSSRRAVGWREGLEEDSLEGWGKSQRIPGGWIPRAQSKDSFEKERAVKSAKRNGVVKEDEG